MKKLVWVALATFVSAAAAALSVKGLAYGWRRITKEPPPAAPRWAQMLLGGALRKQVDQRVQPTTV